MSNAPTIKPIKTKEYEVKQSKYSHVPKLPLRSMIVGPSGCGKTILLQNLILTFIGAVSLGFRFGHHL